VTHPVDKFYHKTNTPFKNFEKMVHEKLKNLQTFFEHFLKTWGFQTWQTCEVVGILE